MIDERFGTIKGLSERRRLPLLGKIRLGIKCLSQKGVEYPKETDYFVCPDEVKAIYGNEPKELDIMLPVANKNIIFPTAYRWYGKTRGLKCIGNGEIANRWSDDKKSLQEIECPCEICQDKLDAEGKIIKKAECKQRAFLMVILPKVSMGGVYQLSTSSYNSIVDINSGLDYVEALLGRIVMVPLKLKREKIETHNEGNKQIHHTLKILFDGNIDFINQLRENTKKILLQSATIQLPPPKDENPEFDETDVIEKDITDEEKETEKPVKQENNFDIENRKTEIEKLHSAEIVREIKTILEKQNKKTKQFELALLHKYNKSAFRWSDIGKPVLIDILLDLEQGKEILPF